MSQREKSDSGPERTDPADHFWNLRSAEAHWSSPEDFVKFQNFREIYERRIESKNRGDDVNVPATPYRYSVDELVLDLIIRAS